MLYFLYSTHGSALSSYIIIIIIITSNDDMQPSTVVLNQLAIPSYRISLLVILIIYALVINSLKTYSYNLTDTSLGDATSDIRPTRVRFINNNSLFSINKKSSDPFQQMTLNSIMI